MSKEDGKIIEQGDFVKIGKPNIPSVLRDNKGRIRWKLKGNTDEQNGELAIRNIQGLFLEKFPEFDGMFPRQEDGKILENKREEARDFILESVGTYHKFISVIGFTAADSKISVPYLEGSFKVAIRKSFISWGIKFQFDKEKESLFPKDKRGKIDWSALRGKSEYTSLLEIWAKTFIENGHKITSKDMKDAGVNSILQEVNLHYPGGLTELQKKLGVDKKIKPRYYWKNPKNIEVEVQDFLKTTGMELTQKNLSEAGKSSAIKAIDLYYPGGWSQLRTNLNLKAPRKPNGYWTQEQIEKDSIDFYATERHFSQRFLVSKGRYDLLSAIAELYEGGMVQLRINLGLEIFQKPFGFWTPENIEKKSLEFYQKTGKLTQQSLHCESRDDLLNAIRRHYPGGMQALKEKLGITESKNSNISLDEAREELSKLLEVENE
ncbi:MAG: hypothetical protein Q8P80_00415 [Candidatus Levybacteria bacterium]|nr:hypothetical protein [Candidatus Levybacteria bacterium]